MKIIIISILLAFTTANAEYNVTYMLDKKSIIFSSWNASESIKGSWNNIDNPYGCSNWTPLETSMTIGEKFIQSASDCKQNQERTIQNQEKDAITGVVRNVGPSYKEYQIITVSSSRNAIGQGPATATCVYNATSRHYTYYNQYDDMRNADLYWGTYIGKLDILVGSVNIDGFKYSRGSNISGAIFEICRVAL